MTPLEALAKLEADYEASTPGEWAEHYGMVRVVTDVAPEWSNSAVHIVSMHNSAKALFAGMRALEEIERLTGTGNDPGGAKSFQIARAALAALSEEQPS